MKKEIWKDIPGYEGLYKIRENGDILSLIRTKVMKATLNRGYMVVCLSDRGVRKQFKVHRLIMMVYRPINNPDIFVINHINGIRNDNRIDNLEWVTSKENNNHAIKTGLNRGKNKLTDDEVREIKTMIESLRPNTIREISTLIQKQFNKVSIRTIESIVVNRRWSHLHI